MTNNFAAWAWGAGFLLLGFGLGRIFQEVICNSWAWYVVSAWLALNLLIVVFGFLKYRTETKKERREH